MTVTTNVPFLTDDACLQWVRSRTSVTTHGSVPGTDSEQQLQRQQHQWNNDVSVCNTLHWAGRSFLIPTTTALTSSPSANNAMRHGQRPIVLHPGVSESLQGTSFLTFTEEIDQLHGTVVGQTNDRRDVASSLCVGVPSASGNKAVPPGLPSEQIRLHAAAHRARCHGHQTSEAPERISGGGGCRYSVPQLDGFLSTYGHYASNLCGIRFLLSSFRRREYDGCDARSVAGNVAWASSWLARGSFCVEVPQCHIDVFRWNTGPYERRLAECEVSDKTHSGGNAPRNPGGDPSGWRSPGWWLRVKSSPVVLPELIVPDSASSSNASWARHTFARVTRWSSRDPRLASFAEVHAVTHTLPSSPGGAPAFGRGAVMVGVSGDTATQQASGGFHAKWRARGRCGVSLANESLSQFDTSAFATMDGGLEVPLQLWNRWLSLRFRCFLHGVVGGSLNEGLKSPSPSATANVVGNGMDEWQRKTLASLRAVIAPKVAPDNYVRGFQLLRTAPHQNPAGGWGLGGLCAGLTAVSAEVAVPLTASWSFAWFSDSLLVSDSGSAPSLISSAGYSVSRRSSLPTVQPQQCVSGWRIRTTPWGVAIPQRMECFVPLRHVVRGSLTETGTWSVAWQPMKCGIVWDAARSHDDDV